MVIVTGLIFISIAYGSIIVSIIKNRYCVKPDRIIGWVVMFIIYTVMTVKFFSHEATLRALSELFNGNN